MKAEKFWDFLAPNYEAGDGDPSEREDLEIIYKYLHPEDSVLELACGPGTLAIYLAGRVKEIHAIDISGKMIARAERKAAEQKVNNIHFAHTTIYEAGYPNNSFNVVMAFNILHLLKDAQETVQRINQLLKPGGVFISSTPCLAEKKSVINHLLTPFVKVPSKIGIIPYVKMFRIAELEELLTNGNFQIVETKKFIDGMTDYLVLARRLNG